MVRSCGGSDAGGQAQRSAGCLPSVRAGTAQRPRGSRRARGRAEALPLPAHHMNLRTCATTSRTLDTTQRRRRTSPCPRSRSDPSRQGRRSPGSKRARRVMSSEVRRWHSSAAFTGVGEGEVRRSRTRARHRRAARVGWGRWRWEWCCAAAPHPSWVVPTPYSPLPHAGNPSCRLFNAWSVWTPACGNGCGRRVWKCSPQAHPQPWSTGYSTGRLPNTASLIDGSTSCRGKYDCTRQHYAPSKEQCRAAVASRSRSVECQHFVGGRGV